MKMVEFNSVGVGDLFVVYRKSKHDKYYYALCYCVSDAYAPIITFDKRVISSLFDCAPSVFNRALEDLREANINNPLFDYVYVVGTVISTDS